jgi:N-acetylglucosaminyl-diphospho-decaprenol L-rhamnosyltransferase
MHVAIAIVGFRNAEDVTNCLQALVRSTFADYDIVICENGGSRAFAALKALTPDRMPGGQPVRLIEAPTNLGFAGGVNVCIAASSDVDAVWVLNPDTEPDPKALAALVARLDLGDCDAVGGLLVGGDGRVQAVGGRWRPWLARCESMGMGSGVGDRFDVAAVERAQNYILGASLLASRRFLRATGPMREDYFLYAEEVEWCLRGIAGGMKLGFTPDAVVVHHQGATTGSGAALSKRPRLPSYLEERNKILLIRDRYPRRLPIAALAALLILSWRYGVRGRGGSLGHALAGWWSGLRNRRGRPRFLAA